MPPLWSTANLVKVLDGGQAPDQHGYADLAGIPDALLRQRLDKVGWRLPVTVEVQCTSWSSMSDRRRGLALLSSWTMGGDILTSEPAVN